MNSSGTPVKAQFAHLVMILATSASVGLGDTADPMNGEQKKDLDQARFYIDLLGILEEKTRGQLNPQESQELTNLLGALRLRFVEAQTSS